jgi:archaetidylinositol phosphate synthase
LEAALLNRFRRLFSRALRPAALALGRLGLAPLHLTLLSALFSLLAFLFFSGLLQRSLALGGLLVLLSGLFDALDGELARARGEESKRGAFLDSTLDRLSEGALYIGLLMGAWASPALCSLALLLSFMVSYTRARAEGLGVELKGVGIAERAERLLLLALFSLAGYAALGLLLVALLSALALGQRIRAALEQL